VRQLLLRGPLVRSPSASTYAAWTTGAQPSASTTCASASGTTPGGDTRRSAGAFLGHSGVLFGARACGTAPCQALWRAGGERAASGRRAGGVRAAHGQGAASAGSARVARARRAHRGERRRSKQGIGRGARREQQQGWKTPRTTSRDIVRCSSLAHTHTRTRRGRLSTPGA
jgi:hypothetical protein